MCQRPGTGSSSRSVVVGNAAGALRGGGRWSVDLVRAWVLQQQRATSAAIVRWGSAVRQQHALLLSSVGCFFWGGRPALPAAPRSPARSAALATGTAPPAAAAAKGRRGRRSTTTPLAGCLPCGCCALGIAVDRPSQQAAAGQQQGVAASARRRTMPPPPPPSPPLIYTKTLCLLPRSGLFLLLVLRHNRQAWAQVGGFTATPSQEPAVIQHCVTKYCTHLSLACAPPSLRHWASIA